MKLDRRAALAGVAAFEAAPKAFAQAFPSTSQRLSAEMLNQLAGVKIERVPYEASPQALGDVASSQVQVMFPDLPQASTQIQAGRVRGLATTGAKRTSVAPDLPAIPAYVNTETEWWTKSIKAAGIEPE